jgi:dienelactone hydrolase
VVAWIVVLSIASAIGSCIVVPARADAVDPFALGMRGQPDLRFPDGPTAFVAAGGSSKIFKPDGPGPFAGIVVLPNCSGHSNTVQSFDWAQRALAHGYAVIVVDPFAPRGIRDNCSLPVAVTPSRLLKDGFDAADALRKQPFVDPNRIGLVGFSLGAMTGLGAAAVAHSHPSGGKPFGAIVAEYPVCIIRNAGLRSGVAELHFEPSQVDVPLLVEMGSQDTEGPMGDCIPAFDRLKAAGAPVDYRIYPATHGWDMQEYKMQPFHKTGFEGQSITYAYSALMTQRAADDAFAFFGRYLNPRP